MGDVSEAYDKRRWEMYGKGRRRREKVEQGVSKEGLRSEKRSSVISHCCTDGKCGTLWLSDVGKSAFTIQYGTFLEL